jgi:hypothetical protein
MRIYSMYDDLLFEDKSKTLKRAMEHAAKLKVDLSHINIHRVDLEGADLRGIIAPYGEFSAANLEGSNLRGADLRLATLSGVNFGGADLQEANLRGALLGKTDLSGADLRGADLRGAHAEEAHFEKADLRGASLEGADLLRAHFEGADLRQTSLDRTDTRDVDFTGTTLPSVLDWSPGIGAEAGDAPFSPLLGMAEGRVWRGVIHEVPVDLVYTRHFLDRFYKGEPGRPAVADILDEEEVLQAIEDALSDITAQWMSIWDFQGVIKVPKRGLNMSFITDTTDQGMTIIMKNMMLKRDYAVPLSDYEFRVAGSF